METLFALQAVSEGNTPMVGGFPSPRPVTRSFYVFFDVRQNKWLSKQSWRRWFGTPSRSLWGHCNGSIDYMKQWWLIVIYWTWWSYSSDISIITKYYEMYSILLFFVSEFWKRTKACNTLFYISHVVLTYSKVKCIWNNINLTVNTYRLSCQKLWLKARLRNVRWFHLFHLGLCAEVSPLTKLTYGAWYPCQFN